MSPDPDSIDEALGAHHAELGGLLADFTRALGGETAAAAALLDRFSRGLAAHMEWEERILFPGVRRVSRDRPRAPQGHPGRPAGGGRGERRRVRAAETRLVGDAPQGA
ncbi:MAG: hemerythrin domain-containing protein [Planctomycetes bacterium]|nr:hemerythrin domain-containing protein [Planctomycetota bacterium]